MCVCLYKFLFYHCSFSSFPLLSFFRFPWHSVPFWISNAHLPPTQTLAFSIYLFFLSSCLSACTCVCVCARARACPSIYLSISFLSFDSAFAAQHPPTHPPPQLPGRDPTLNITTERSIFPKMCFFLQKCWICWICSKASLKKCFFLRKCWICWICWMFLELTVTTICPADWPCPLIFAKTLKQTKS